MRENRISDKKAGYFSTRLVERVGFLLVTKNIAIGPKSRRFVEEMAIIDKSNSEIEQAFRLASEKVNRA